MPIDWVDLLDQTDAILWLIDVASAAESTPTYPFLAAFLDAWSEVPPSWRKGVVEAYREAVLRDGEI